MRRREHTTTSPPTARTHRAARLAGPARQLAPAAGGPRCLAAASARTPKKTSDKAVTKPETRGRASAAKKPTPAGNSPDELSGEDLQQALAEAGARIAELEARLAGVTDRVAWIADRLHALLHDEN